MTLTQIERPGDFDGPLEALEGRLSRIVTALALDARLELADDVMRPFGFKTASLFTVDDVPMLQLGPTGLAALPAFDSLFNSADVYGGPDWLRLRLLGSASFLQCLENRFLSYVEENNGLFEVYSDFEDTDAGSAAAIWALMRPAYYGLMYPTGTEDFYVAGTVQRSPAYSEYLQLAVGGLETGYFLDSNYVDSALIGKPAVLIHGYEISADDKRGSAISSLHPLEGPICDAKLDLSGGHVVVSDPEDFWGRYRSFIGGEIF